VLRFHLPAWPLLMLAVAPCATAMAQTHDMSHMDMAGPVGSVHFGNSCTHAVGAQLDHAVASLYSFWFIDARERFQRVAQQDPDCAIAYWGVAMSNYEQISGGGLPEGRQLKAGRDALVNAKPARERTPREQAYLDAAAIIFAADTIPDHDTRVRRFSAAMGRIATDYPLDQQAQVIYAMSLLKDGMPADPDLVLARQSLDILNRVLKVEPDNPGVLHFIIHATDNPRMASLGLDAARRYAKVAAGAPHALHMPSHIFARLGLWVEDINSNLASQKAAEQPPLLHTVAENRLHAMDFLEYAYLQTGRDDLAASIANEAREVRAADFSIGLGRYHDSMEADFPTHLLLETGDWAAAEALQPGSASDPYARRAIFWAQAVAAGHLKDPKTAARSQERARATYKTTELAAVEAHPTPIWAEIQAWTLFSAGATDKAVALLRPAADLQDRTGKGETELPVREMIGDMLRLGGRNPEALAEYRISLKTDPGRFNTLLHAGEVAQALGLRDEAAGYYRQLLKNAPHPSPKYAALLSQPREFLVSIAARRDH
jgi:tetratricopeptide (TPR) repeat protein